MSLQLSLRLKFACLLWLEMASQLLILEGKGVGELLMVPVHVSLASLNLGPLHVSVLFLGQIIISRLVLACDPLDSLYLYLFPRFLDFYASPFPLVRRLRLVRSLSLGVIEVF